MGEVWRGTDLAIDRRVAIKVLRPEHEDDEEGVVRFRAEAHHAGSLSHPNIAQVFDYGEPAGAEPGYLVMELVDGLSLTRILDDGPLAPEDVMDVVAQTARGLAAAHRTGLVHRDIKPGNLLLRSDGLVKITDFGIAHADGQTTFTQPGMLIGTPAYLSPERVSGASATPAGDLYALGVVAHQCLTGHVPFAGEALAVALAHLDRGLPALPPSVPPEVAALVTELTRKDPAARPPSAWDVALQAEYLRVLLSSPGALSRHDMAAAPLAVPGAGRAVLAGAALAGAGPPGPAPAGAPADWTRTPPRGGRPRSRGSRRAPGRASLPARGALAATGLAAIGFIAWTLATLPAPAGATSPAVAPPVASRSSAPSPLSRQSPLAATRNAGTSGGNAVVAQAAATAQPSVSTTRPAPSSPAAPPPSSTPGTPSDSPTPSTSPTPTPTPTISTPPPTPTSPAPGTSTPAPTTPAPTPSGGSRTSSTAPRPSATASAGLILASGPIVP
jgi:eukaryotic-like serine/threonine-protein kinase